MRTVQSLADMISRPGYFHYFRSVMKEYGPKGMYKQFRYEVRRPFSRALIRKYAGENGQGLEIGVGARTISPPGRTLLSDAFFSHARDSSIAEIIFRGDEIPFPDAYFSFIISEHTLEHMANPLKALYEWKRVLKPGGHVIMLLPHKERTFDRERERTTLQHLEEDLRNGVGDDDRTHLGDWMENVITKGLAPHYAGTPAEKMVELGIIHHHVWTERDAEEMLRFAGLEPVYLAQEVPDRRDSFAAVARKPGPEPNGIMRPE